MHTTLINPTTLAGHLDDANWVLVDCRFDLTDPAKGGQLYAEGHIPGARFADLDTLMSGGKTGRNGRHPLPTPDEMSARFGALGISPNRQVVAYDADSGMYAARLWWMLRYMGHRQVAVLDGGLARWQREGHAARGGPERWTSATFAGTPQASWRLTADEVQATLGQDDRLLVDARTNERYRGIGETLDKVGGHIPGAANFFWQDNLTADKTFKNADELKAQWHTFLAGRPAQEVVMYCGSGVTACVNLLGLEHAGLTGARLFAGSWSEWSQDPDKPVEK